MARVEILLGEDRFNLQKDINALIKDLNFDEFQILYTAQEAYPNEADKNTPERLFTAMVILKK